MLAALAALALYAAARETRSESKVAPTDVLAQAQRHIAAREYWASETAEGLQAPNRRHDLRTWFEPGGIRVHGRTASGSPALVALTLAGVGRGDALAAVSPGEVTSAEGRVEIRRPGLVEWYVNSPDGLEQGFTFDAKPATDATGDLVLELAVAGATASALGGEVALATEAGRTLRYGALATFDATGRALPSVFDVAAPDRIRLVVDDADALYPIVIDPLLDDWAYDVVTGDQDDSQLGFSIASAGDVNGDGYADVIIGAPLYDSGETDEGMAFVFHGWFAGIATHPLFAQARLQGDEVGARFGYSVAPAGDVNGDGYADVIVGALFYGSTANPPVDGGAAFVFLGSPTGIAHGSPASAHARLRSDQANANFGQHVASAGDVNGDGFSDVIVGAYTYESGSAQQTDEGAAFVFLGSASGIAHADASTAHAQLEGNQLGAAMGASVASAGDVNGDGFSDVIVGAHQYDAPTSNEGAAFIFLGSSTGIADGDPSTAHAQLEGDQTDAAMGRSVASAGDVNGDGYADVVVGAALYNAGHTDEGAAFVFHGSASGISDAGPAGAATQLEANEGFAQLGVGVASAGDVNGDGYADVIVGAILYDGGGLGDAGAAFVFTGSAAGVADGTPATAFAQFHGGEAGARMGRTVASAGDVNGDGFDEVIIGVERYDAEGTDRGRVRVIPGSPQMPDDNPASAHMRIQGDQDGAEFGSGVASAGDVNGDGYEDVLVAAPSYDGGETDEGAVFVVLGTAAVPPNGLPATPSATLTGGQAGARFGSSVASAGDVNGDGYSDVIVGAELYDAPDTDEGAAFVFLGSAAGIADGNATSAHARLEADLGAARLGSSVASAGDVNGDGYADVIVGAEYYGAAETDEGAAFVFLGSAAGIADASPATAHARLEGNLANGRLGSSVSSAGDVNGDGYADLVVGSSGSLGAYVFLGSAAGVADADPTTAHARIVDDSLNFGLGASVATAGDVNGDGYADVLVGGFAVNLPPYPYATAFIFEGSAAGIADATGNTADTRLYFTQTDGSSGSTLAPAGDIDADGHADVLVGVRDHAIGTIFVVLGSADGVPDGGSGSPYARLEGGLGASVAAADVNGDGYPDVIAGSPLYEGGGIEGAAFVFRGNTNGRSLLARQRRGDGSGIAVAPWGASSSLDGFSVELRASHSAGKGRVRAEVEACGPGVAFGDASCASALGAWTAVGGATPGVTLTQTLSGLDPDTLHRWRARVQRAPATGVLPANPAHGPWRRVGAQAREADVRTGFAAICGDGTVQPLLGETCDDGDTEAGDGCSATCWIEQGALALFGTGMGGGLSLEVNGVLVSVPTRAGHSAESVLADVAAAIAAHPSLGGVDVAVVGGVLYLSGSTANAAVADPGLGLVPNDAVTTGYDARAAFDAALGGAAATVETFEGLADQQLVTSVGGVAFATVAPVEAPMATSAFDTRSGVLSLGLQNADEAFVDGDALTMTLATPSTFVALYVVTSDPAEAGEIALVTPVGAAWNAATPDSTLPDGGFVYFLGLVSDTPFQQVALGFAAQDGHFVYTVDDYLPEPDLLASLCSGLALLEHLRRRRARSRGRMDT